MTTIRVELHGDQAVLPKSDLEQLLKLARKAGPVQFDIGREELTTGDMTQLAVSGGVFDFWTDEGKDIYSLSDGEPL